VQTGHEKTLTGLMAALAGANLIYGAGMTESGVTFDAAQFVLDNELAAMVRHTVAGIPVTDETLAVDDIHAVGPFGDFLSLDATMRHMRSQSQPTLMDRRVREEWQGTGGHDAYARAQAKAREILAEHRPEPLPEDVLAQMRQVVEEADRSAGVR
jgi:trimethylamine---corrinoid protein Co-methyltransferase